MTLPLYFAEFGETLCVLVTQFQEFVFAAPLGNDEFYFVALHLGEPFSKNLLILDFMGDEYFIWNVGGFLVVLFQERLKSVGVFLLVWSVLLGLEFEIFLVDNFPTTNLEEIEKYLFVGDDVVDDIQIGVAWGRDALVFHNILHGLNFVADSGGYFKLLLDCGFLHVLLELGENVVVFSFQETDHLVDDGTILFLVDGPDAWANAALDVVVNARVLDRCFCHLHLMFALWVKTVFLWHLVVDGQTAMAIREDTFEDFERFDHLVFGGFWSKVTGFVFLHLASYQNARKILIDRYFDVNVVLVVLHEDVVFGAVLFDHVGLEHHCFQIGADLYVFNILNLLDHFLGFGGLITRGLEVARDAALEVLGFANVNNLPIGTFKFVDAGLLREILKNVLNVFLTFFGFHGAFIIVEITLLLNRISYYDGPIMKASFPPKNLKHSVYATAAFFDVFERPLLGREFQNYLLGVEPISEEIEEFLRKDTKLHSRHDYYFLPGREEVLATREARDAMSDVYWKKVWKYVPLLQMVPFIRAVAVCNTLALDNCTSDSDIDLFIITKKNRIFLARVLSGILFHLLGVRRHDDKVAGRFCLSFYLSEDAMNLDDMRLKNDAYLYFWMRSLEFVYRDSDTIYSRFFEKNTWFTDHIHGGMGRMLKSKRKWYRFLGRLQEFLFGGFLGDWIEGWLEKKHQARFASRKKELGPNADVVVSRTMLKFHNIDRRAEYNERFFQRYESLL